MSIIETVKSQAQTIKTITEKPNERLVTNTKDISEINGSVITVERYSRKTCLLISNIDLNLSPVANVLSLINDTLKIGTKEIDLVASHTVNGNRVAPIIVKFLYYKHRDLEWVRRTWRMHIKHSLNKPAFRGILCPGNRSVQAEEREKERERERKKERHAHVFTCKQELYAFYPGFSDAKATNIKYASETKHFVPKRNNEENEDPCPVEIENVEMAYLRLYVTSLLLCPVLLGNPILFSNHGV